MVPLASGESQRFFVSRQLPRPRLLRNRNHIRQHQSQRMGLKAGELFLAVSLLSAAEAPQATITKRKQITCDLSTYQETTASSGSRAARSASSVTGGEASVR